MLQNSNSNRKAYKYPLSKLSDRINGTNAILGVPLSDPQDSCIVTCVFTCVLDMMNEFELSVLKSSIVNCHSIESNIAIKSDPQNILFRHPTQTIPTCTLHRPLLPF